MTIITNWHPIWRHLASHSNSIFHPSIQGHYQTRSRLNVRCVTFNFCKCIYYSVSFECCRWRHSNSPMRSWEFRSWAFWMFSRMDGIYWSLQYIPRNMHTVFALLCFVVVIHWLIFPYPSGLLHWHCGNLMIAPVPAKQPWWIWINTSCEFIMNDCITTTKQSTTIPCAYFLGYTVRPS